MAQSERARRSQRELVCIGWVSVEAETDRSLLVHVANTGEQVWIPRSQIDDDSLVESRMTSPGPLVVSRWFADRLGL